MNQITTFDIHKEALLDLLRGIQQGKIQLPDFQRSWVWDDAQIRSLLSSISLAYPVGVVILLQLGNPRVRFKPRLIEGTHLEHLPTPSLLILDGQQRLTALFQSLMSGQPVITKDSISKRSIQRWYYIDIYKALEYPPTDREEAIVGLAEDYRFRGNGNNAVTCSKDEQEYELGLFPLAKVFDYSEWRSKYSRYWEYDSAKLELLDCFEGEVIKCFEHYQMPLIQLRQELPKEAVCQVFEKVNSLGKHLTFFDLITAAYAADDFSLRDDWTMRQQRLGQKSVLSVIDSTDFLQAITLISMYSRRHQPSPYEAKGIRALSAKYSRSQVLQLTLSEYKAWAEPITKGFEEAARLLHGQKIFDARDLPYPMQLVALSALFTLLGDRVNNEQVRAKMISWFWCGAFGELYAGAVMPRAARDLVEVEQWVEGGSEPLTMLEANFAPGRLLRLRSRQSAAFRGICTLLLQQGAMDFSTGEAITDVKYFNDRIDSHHIFPQAWCRAQGIDDRWANCIVNKTLLSAKTNKAIGSRPPSVYLAQLEQKGIERKRLNTILCSHLIEPKTLWTDDFEAFFRARSQALVNLIGQRMGKTVTPNLALEQDALLANDLADEEVV